MTHLPRGSVALGASGAQCRYSPRIGPGAGLPRAPHPVVLSLVLSEAEAETKDLSPPGPNNPAPPSPNHNPLLKPRPPPNSPAYRDLTSHLSAHTGPAPADKEMPLLRHRRHVKATALTISNRRLLQGNMLTQGRACAADPTTDRASRRTQNHYAS